MLWALSLALSCSHTLCEMCLCVCVCLCNFRRRRNITESDRSYTRLSATCASNAKSRRYTYHTNVSTVLGLHTFVGVQGKYTHARTNTFTSMPARSATTTQHNHHRASRPTTISVVTIASRVWHLGCVQSPLRKHARRPASVRPGRQPNGRHTYKKCIHSMHHTRTHKHRHNTITGEFCVCVRVVFTIRCCCAAVQLVDAHRRHAFSCYPIVATLQGYVVCAGGMCVVVDDGGVRCTAAARIHSRGLASLRC